MIVAPKISLEINGSWVDPTTTLQSGVTAIRIERFTGAVYIEFNAPASVKLSPSDWESDYQTRAKQRNLMIDLLGNGGTAVVLPATTSITYKFTTSQS